MPVVRKCLASSFTQERAGSDLPVYLGYVKQFCFLPGFAVDRVARISVKNLGFPFRMLAIYRRTEFIVWISKTLMLVFEAAHGRRP